MVGGFKFLRRLFAAPAMAKYVVAEKLPGPSVQSDDELLDYARANGSTVYHASCSCMMGQHAMAVVDDQLRVHGVESLRVIDASVMPAVTSTNTNAPTIMIAEKGAAIIKGAAEVRVDPLVPRVRPRGRTRSRRDVCSLRRRDARSKLARPAGQHLRIGCSANGNPR
jgi:choline dehydrogenase-like flavoprotein